MRRRGALAIIAWVCLICAAARRRRLLFLCSPARVVDEARVLMQRIAQR